MNLTHGAGRVGRVMQHAVRVDDVETFIRERQSFAIGNREIARLSINGQVLLRNLDRARRQIGAGDFRAATSKLQKIGAHATTNLEQPHASEFVKAHYLGHPWRVVAIAMALDCLKELTRADLMLIAVHSAGGIFAPLFARALFFVRWLHLSFTVTATASGSDRPGYAVVPTAL